MIRPMKWHIYHDENKDGAFPLCWESMAIEFDSEENALQFAKEHPEIGSEYFVKENILYHDGGYITEFAVRQLIALEAE